MTRASGLAHRGQRFRRGAFALRGFRSVLRRPFWRLCLRFRLRWFGLIFRLLGGQQLDADDVLAAIDVGLGRSLGLLAELDQALAGDLDGLLGLLRGQARTGLGVPCAAAQAADPDHPQRRDDQCGQSWSETHAHPPGTRRRRPAQEKPGGTDR